MHGLKRYFWAGALLALLCGAETLPAASDYVFPFVANGTYSTFAYRTRFTMCSYTGNVTMRFYDGNGSPMSMTMVCPQNSAFSGTKSVFSGKVDSYETFTCTTSGTGGLQTGWVLVKSETTMKVISCEYCLNRTDIVNPPMEFSLAVPPVKPTTHAYVDVIMAANEPLTGQTTDTSFSLVNLNNETITVSCFVDGGDSWKSVALPAGGMYSAYARDLYPGHDFGTNYKGFLEVRSGKPFFLMGVRGINHPSRTVYTSLPMTTEVERGRSETFFEREPDDSYATAGQLSRTPAYVYGAFSTSNDRDSYTFHARAGDAINVVLLAGVLGAHIEGAPVSMELWDDSYHIVATGIEAPWHTEDKTLQYYVPADGYYSISVVGSCNCEGAYPNFESEYLLYIR